MKDNTATGFSFRVYKSAALLEAIKRALALYTQKNGWKKLVVNCLEQDLSWRRAAQEYIVLYKFTQDARLQARKSMKI